MTDYTKLKDPDLLKECGTDAAKWAKAFCQITEKNQCVIDEDLMIGWFANAIMNTHDQLTGRGPVVLPDGSAFVGGRV